MLTAEEILVGGDVTHEIAVPANLISSTDTVGGSAVLRPLTVRDLQRIAKAARDDDELSAALMISAALVEPALTLDQVSQMPAGLARFFVSEINALSGISTPIEELEELVRAPLARACFTLAKEFGWTPDAVSGMTMGQVLMYLEMSSRRSPE